MYNKYMGIEEEVVEESIEKVEEVFGDEVDEESTEKKANTTKETVEEKIENDEN